MVIAQKYPRYATFLHAIVNHAFKLCQKDELVAQTALMACHSHAIHHYWIPLALQDWIAAHLQQFPCLHSFWSRLDKMPYGHLTDSFRDWCMGTVTNYRGGVLSLTGVAQTLGNVASPAHLVYKGCRCFLSAALSDKHPAKHLQLL